MDEVERTARAIAAEKMMLRKDVHGLGLPDEKSTSPQEANGRYH
jgi:hypothetical protein